MTTIAQVKERIQDLFEERAEHLGRETGFVKRERQLSGADFVQGLVFGLLQGPALRKQPRSRKVDKCGTVCS